jgi:tRNA pseudouridine55 synthase
VLVDKPAGLTSHDVVHRVRRAIGSRSVGHTGTLDPFATGLLVLLVGRATRLARFVEAQPKTYLAVARLGQRTDTDDRTGAPVGELYDGPALGRSEVQAALSSFAGEQVQRPPVYSAKHVGGRRSYQLARRGRVVEPPPVTITVHAIELIECQWPEAVFRATVSPGTYLRALARDLGDRLGVGAHLTSLRREAIGSLRVEDAVGLDAVSPASVLPVRAVLGHLPVHQLDEAARLAVSHGRPVPADAGAAGDVALVRGDEFVAIARVEEGWLRPSVVLGLP